MAKEVAFTIKIKESGEIRKITANADELAGALNNVKKSAENLRTKAINFAQWSQSIEAAQRSVSELQGALAGLSAAYAAEEAAVSKLQTVMRNTMDATDDEVKSILELASAQQKLGVIGDEVQIAGAQELATYLNKTETLKKLIPVMNDMVAQQYGLEASQESAAQIATMLGKVMEGQTSALSRYGYSFTEAQEQILKFGTEEQRAATLADVVSESVGGVNAELAKTSSGRIVQINNDLGDMAEKLGKVATAVMPAVTVTAQLGSALANVVKLVSGAKIVFAGIPKIIATTKAIASLNAALVLSGKSSTAAIGAMRRLITVTGSATAATKALKAAKLGLAGVVLAGLGIAITSIVKKQKEAQKAAEDLAAAEEEIRSSVANTRAEMELDILKLANFNGSQKEAAKLVEELNDKYGDKLGMQSSITAWYDNLSGKIDLYCTKLAKEAKLQKLLNDISNAKLKKEDLQSKIAETPKEQVISQTNNAGSSFTYTVENSDWTALNKEITACDDLISKSTQDVEMLLGEIASVSSELSQGVKSSTDKSGLKDIDKAIADYKSSVENAVAVNRIFGDSTKNQTVRLEAMRSGITSLIKSYGAEDDRIRQLIQDYNTLAQSDKRPTELKTLEDIDTAIQYQQSLRSKATAENIAGIDAEIQRLNALKTALEDKAHTEISIDQITSYEQLEKELSYYEDKLKRVSSSEREGIQLTINALKKLQSQWDEQLQSFGVNTDIAQLSNIQDLYKAISIYKEKAKKASAEELLDINRVIYALEQKKGSLESLADIPSMEAGLSELSSLSGTKLQMKLELIGLDNLKNTITKLKALLANTTNPLTEGQKEQVEGMITAYQSYATTLQTTHTKGSLVTGMLGNIGSIMGNLSGVVGEGASAWLSYGANILSAVAQALPAIASVIGGNIAQAFAGAAAQSQTVPFPYNLISLTASMAAVGAAVASIPKFADGGIAYGPTLGIFGEYAGASNNPEVVAPLDRLRELIGGSGESSGTQSIELKIKGRDLVGIYDKNMNFNRRTR